MFGSLVGRLIIPGDKERSRRLVAVRHHEVIIIKFRRKLLIIWLIIFWRNIIKIELGFVIHRHPSSPWWLSCVVGGSFIICCMYGMVCVGRMCDRCSFTTYLLSHVDVDGSNLIRRWPCCRSMMEWRRSGIVIIIRRKAAQLVIVEEVMEWRFYCCDLLGIRRVLMK